jgi:hypothetical protein
MLDLPKHDEAVSYESQWRRALDCTLGAILRVFEPQFALCLMKGDFQ